MTIKLSICMTTFGRAEYICETVTSIVSQMTEEVELVILDSNADDETSKKLDILKSKLAVKNLRIIRNKVNGGLDADFDKVVQKALGVYCWLFPDDDTLLPGAIPYVLSCIRFGVDDVIVVNSQICDEKNANILVKEAINVPHIEHFTLQNIEQYCDTALSYNSYIGSIIVRRDFWTSGSNTEFYGSMFIHIGAIFSKGPKNITLLPRPVISIRYGNASWSARSFEIWAFLWPKIVWSSPDFRHLSRIGNVLVKPYTSFQFLAFHRMMNNISVGTILRFSQYLTTSEKARIFFVALFPKALLMLLAIIMLRNEGPKRNTIKYDILTAEHCPFYLKLLAKKIWRWTYGLPK